MAFIDDLWTAVHYAQDHKSAPAGSFWREVCTDEPCPKVREYLRAEWGHINLAKLRLAFDQIGNCEIRLAGDDPHIHASDLGRLVEVYEGPTRRPLVENCRMCDSIRSYNASDSFPPHDASSKCESGKHPHCSCDICF